MKWEGKIVVACWLSTQAKHLCCCRCKHTFRTAIKLSNAHLTEYWNTDLKIAKEGIKTTCSICWPDLPPPPLSFRTCVDWHCRKNTRTHTLLLARSLLFTLVRWLAHSRAHALALARALAHPARAPRARTSRTSFGIWRAYSCASEVRERRARGARARCAREVREVREVWVRGERGACACCAIETAKECNWNVVGAQTNTSTVPVLFSMSIKNKISSNHLFLLAGSPFPIKIVFSLGCTGTSQVAFSWLVCGRMRTDPMKKKHVFILILICSIFFYHFWLSYHESYL